MALVNMSVVEQRYRAVLAVERGEPRMVVASQYGVSRQTLHTWLTRYVRSEPRQMPFTVVSCLVTRWSFVRSGSPCRVR